MSIDQDVYAELKDSGVFDVMDLQTDEVHQIVERACCTL
jgi:preprotein translocase subunit SecB